MARRFAVSRASRRDPSVFRNIRPRGVDPPGAPGGVGGL